MSEAAQPARLRVPSVLREPFRVVVATVREAIEDRVPGLAAEIAFFVLLSLPALVLSVLAGVGTAGRLFDATWQVELAGQIRQGAALILTGSSIDVVDDLLRATIEDGRAGVFGFGLLLALVSASRALGVVVETITIAYHLEETRPRWQQRVWGLVLTVAALVIGLVVAPAVIVGPRFGATLSTLLGGVPGLAGVWSLLYWPVAVVVVTLLVAGLFHFAAPWSTPYLQDLPGAALAVVLWLLGSVGLRAYATYAITSDVAYAPIAGPLVVLLWLYVTAFALLLGAEFNAEIFRRRHPEHVTNEGTH